MGADDSIAAERLRVLATYYREPTRTGDSMGRSATPTHAPVPINVGILDHMKESVAEVVEHARADAQAAQATNPGEETRPRPADDTDVYAWWQSIPIADEARQDARDTVIHRQALEHAIKAGDTKAVRRERCPHCRTVGLFWRAAERKALCVNQRCPDAYGMARTWTLAELAHHHVLEERRLKNRATS